MTGRLYFQCPCGYWARDLGAFHDHATRCRAERQRRQAGIRLQQGGRVPTTWRVGHYLSRMLGFPLTIPDRGGEDRGEDTG